MKTQQNQPDTLIDLDPLCARFSSAAADLEAATAALEKDLAEVRDLHTDELKELTSAVAEAEAAVRQWVELHPESFKAPRTFSLHGVEVGLQALTGSVEFEDEQMVIAALKKVYAKEPETLALLVTTEEKVSKAALRALPADVFTRVGCVIAGAGDAVVVNRSASDVEKMINAAIAKLVKAMVDPQGAAAKKAKKARK